MPFSFTRAVPAAQTPLSLRWETRRHWHALQEEFGGSETKAAVILALVTSDEWVSYSRHKPHYARPPRYRSPLYTYQKVIDAADHLDRQGLIEHNRTSPGHRGWQSSMKATTDLVTRTRRVLLVCPRLEIARPAETIVLRDRGGEFIDYRDDAMTRRMRYNLEEFNAAIRIADISDNVASPMVRIFNRTFSRGGRFYALGGGWQSMKKELRQRITISGEPVAEIDFKTLHPAILYAQAGASLPADSYAIEGWPRSLVKICLLVLINAKNRQSSRLVIANHAAMAPIANPGSQQAIAAADKLINDVKRLHHPIASAFHADKGAELMVLDSALAEKIMHLMLQQGVLVLPVHDSFLVPQSKAALLEKIMLDVAHGAGLSDLQIAYA